MKLSCRLFDKNMNLAALSFHTVTIECKHTDEKIFGSFNVIYPPAEDFLKPPQAETFVLRQTSGSNHSWKIFCPFVFRRKDEK